MSSNFSESIVEDAAIQYLQRLDRAYRRGKS